MPRAPQKINSFVLFDWETGGLSHEKNPVTEFGGIAINGVTLEEILRYDNVIKPYDNSLTYDEGATRIHGLSKERCQKEGIPLPQLVEDLCQFFTEAGSVSSKTAKPILVAHNAGFDIPFLQDVFRRAKVDLSNYLSGYTDSQGNFQPAYIDTIVLSKGCWAEVTDTTTNFKLGSCCERAGVDYIDGHRAMNDVVCMADLFRYLITRLRATGGTQVVVEHGQISTHRQTFEW